MSRSVDELFAEIEKTDDRATYVVLADALVEAGDPRGELMQVQLALDDEPELPTQLRALARPDLSDRSDALDRATVKELRARMHASRRARIQALLGPFAGSTDIALGFHYGLLDHVRLEASGALPIVARRPGAPSVASVLAEIFASPEACMLRTVEIFPHADPSAGEIRRFADSIGEGTPPPSSLRSLRLGDKSDDHSYRIHLGGHEDYRDDVTTLLAAFPHVHELWIDLGTTRLALAPFVSHDLRHVTLVTPYLRPEALRELARSSLPALRSLVVWTGAAYYVEDPSELAGDYPAGSFVGVDDLEPLFAMLDGCADLEHLGICNHAGDLVELVARIATHGFAARLATLDLSFSDAAPAALAPALAKLPTLRNLVVEEAAAGCRTRYRYVVTQE